MLPASDLRSGMAIRLEGEVYRVMSADTHAGGGKMGSVTRARLRNLRTGALREGRFRSDEGVETVEVERQAMEFLYRDGDMSNFMNPHTFEQVALQNTGLGQRAAYLAEGMTLWVEFLEGEPVNAIFPDIIELRVDDTAPPVHSGGTDNVWKEARLENGVTILVPTFIAPGERIRVDVEAGAYAGRIKK